MWKEKIFLNRNDFEDILHKTVTFRKILQI